MEEKDELKQKDLNSDDFILENGFMLADDYKEEPVKVKKKGRGKSVFKTIIWIFVIIAVSLSIAGSIIYAGADFLGIGFGRGKNCVVEIPSGASTKVIAERLNDVNAVRWPLVFRVYSKLKHFDGKYKYGVYSFNNEAGYDIIADMLMTEGAKAQSVTVTIPERADVDKIAKILVKNKVCTREDFIDAVQNGDFTYDFVKEIPKDSVHYRLEGYLFPDTYDFYNYDSKECAFLAVDKMLSTLDSKLSEEMCADILSTKYNIHQIMTMASIVELEASGGKKEMSNVAAVFYNRLKSKDFSTLGSSPTRKYPYGNGRYDTYVSKGLPPGPLCSPGFDAINAAVKPSENFDYYYFVTDAKMKFYYNKTLSQHNSTIAKLKAENNWIYEEW